MDPAFAPLIFFSLFAAVFIPLGLYWKRQEERDLCKLCHHHEKRHYQGTYCVLCRCPQFEKRR
jgi:hypothetical protein